jgi:hypothetical protein
MYIIKKLGHDNNDTICRIDGTCLICEKREYKESHHLLARSSNPPFNKNIAVCSVCQGLLHSFPRVSNHRELTKAGLERAKLNGKILGRRYGAKDKHKRSNEGYLLRHKKERIKKGSY